MNTLGRWVNFQVGKRPDYLKIESIVENKGFYGFIHRYMMLAWYKNISELAHIYFPQLWNKDFSQMNDWLIGLLYGVWCHFQQYFSYIVVVNAPIHAFLVLFYPTLWTTFFPNYWLLSDVTPVETMDSSERGMNPVSMTIVNPRKEYWPNRVSATFFSQVCNATDWAMGLPKRSVISTWALLLYCCSVDFLT